MYNVHKEMYTFYDKYVRLSQEKQSDLADYRDKNLKRLREGLQKLGYALPERTPGQGSYAMSTIVQHPENDYDIDTAIVFAEADLPESPLKARQQILKAVEEGGGSFKRPPEVRTNAVTVWYEAGYHVDLAVYRSYQNEFENKVVEHAGVEWVRRDPQDITDWFCNQVSTKSPSQDQGATVKEGQMRQIVQLLKMFAKSRPSWGLPGGLLISVLVSECYASDAHRDDAALYNTMDAIRRRLQWNTEILNPVDQDLILTYKDEYVNQVIRLEEKLGKALDWLNPLCEYDCDELSAYKAWNNVFDHEYWSELVDGVELHRAEKFVGSFGTLYTTKPAETTVQSPSHRFYGEE